MELSSGESEMLKEGEREGVSLGACWLIYVPSKQSAHSCAGHVVRENLVLSSPHHGGLEIGGTRLKYSHRCSLFIKEQYLQFW